MISVSYFSVNNCHLSVTSIKRNKISFLSLIFSFFSLKAFQPFPQVSVASANFRRLLDRNLSVINVIILCSHSFIRYVCYSILKPLILDYGFQELDLPLHRADIYFCTIWDRDWTHVYPGTRWALTTRFSNMPSNDNY